MENNQKEKERYPSFIYIPHGDKLPKFTKKIVSGLQLQRSKTIMGYEEEIKNFEKKDLPDSLFKMNNPSAFSPVEGSPDGTGAAPPHNCNLN